MKPVHRSLCLCLSLAALFASPIPAEEKVAAGDPNELRQMERLHAARKLGDAGRWAEALRTEIDPVLEHFESRYAGDTRRVYCCRSSEETVACLMEAASKNTPAIAIGPTWAMAAFMKAYALIELGRTEEARPHLERAIELAPFNAQYLSEKAHLLQLERRWTDSQAIFGRAEECARVFTPPDSRMSELARALRGQGYNLVELGELEQAARRYEECLELNTDDRRARDELAYVRQRLARAARP